jgi:hypothetical protein
VLFVGAMLTVAGCQQKAAPKVPLGQAVDTAAALPSGHPDVTSAAGLTPAARAALDSGNVAFKAKNFPEALRQYRVAADAAPRHAAPWFGVYMVAKATGNAALGDSAMKEVQKRTPAPPAALDSAMRGLHPGGVKKVPAT